jgi:hypothetical protein
MLNRGDANAIGEFLRGDAQATAFVVALFETLHAWDGLIDKDRRVTDAEIHLAFRRALIDIPGSAFYQQHFGQLHPLLSVALMNWLGANTLESSGDEATLRIAFIVRSDYCSILLKCMELLHGFEYAAARAHEVRLFFHAEGFDAYRQSLLAERARRNLVLHGMKRAFEGEA